MATVRMSSLHWNPGAGALAGLPMTASERVIVASRWGAGRGGHTGASGVAVVRTEDLAGLGTLRGRDPLLGPDQVLRPALIVLAPPAKLSARAGYSRRRPCSRSSTV